MRILLVTTRFYPFGDATSAVAGNLARALTEKGCEVHIIALSRFKESTFDYEWNGIPVRLFYAPSTITKEQIRAELAGHFARSVRGFIEKVADKGIQKLVPDYNKYSIRYSIMRIYKKAIKEELKKGYHLCVATLNPIEAVWAASRIHFSKTAFAIYQLDPYWNNADLPESFCRERRDLELAWVRKCAFCVTTPLIEKSNREYFGETAGKYVAAEFPCLKETKNNHKTENDGKVHCVFLGTLYPELRPPEKLVDIIAGMTTSQVSFDFYGSGQFLVKRSPGFAKAREKIKLLGAVTSAEAEAKRAEADILVNIDNTSLTLVPSKIFEYISTGKPILNFYFSEESAALEYLKRYPLCLNVNLNRELKDNVREVERFIKESTGLSLDFEDVKKRYIENTPEYVAELCLDAYRRTRVE